ncbi:MAG: hypothetical protein ACR2HM_04955 [Acidimicrobiales bacterium]
MIETLLHAPRLLLVRGCNPGCEFVARLQLAAVCANGGVEGVLR